MPKVTDISVSQAITTLLQVTDMKPRGTIRERIIRVLLAEPNGALTKYQLAKKAESSFPWAHEFINKLEDQKFVRGTTSSTLMVS